MNPESFFQLDRIIHEKGRLAIVSLLAASPSLSFVEMRDLLKMTDGNLTAHLRTLQQAGYIEVSKGTRAGKTATIYALTDRGRTAFSKYLHLLEDIVRQNRDEPE